MDGPLTTRANGDTPPSAARRMASVLRPGLMLALMAAVAAQELRWQMHQPFELTGVSHAVSVPRRVPLTAGYTVRNNSVLPLKLESLSILGDSRTVGVTDTVRLDVTHIVATSGDRPVPAKPGTAFNRHLAASAPEGRTLQPGQSLGLAATYVGSGPGRFRAGPLELVYRWGPFRRSQSLSLGRGYQVVVE
jgi:hypothetical protein